MSLFGQQGKVTGSVKDTSGRPLSGVILALLDEQSVVIQFALSDGMGKFEMPNTSRGHWLDAGLLGYTKERKQWNSSLATYHFTLTPETRILSEVVIKQRPPTELLGDTLKYYVRNFATKEDRTIGDVIRRLPGVEVARDGSIFFNGRKIENLYIEGDDLMDGRYGMAVKVIKKELVESVDIIRNHQPIAVLRDKIFTDNVALNLVLRDSNNIKLSASTQFGIGVPKQIEGSLAPILLSKNFKSVNRIAFNNTGTDYRIEMQQLGNANFVDNIGTSSTDLALSLGSPSPPDVPQNYYYFNRSGVANINLLFKNKKGTQFKFNGSGFADRNRLAYSGSTITYLANDTITFLEEQNVVSRPKIANLGFNVMANQKRFFLNNTLKGSLTEEIINGNAVFNGRGFSQQLSQRLDEFINDFTWMPLLKKKSILEFRWLIGYRSNRQTLKIGRGYLFPVAPQKGYFESVDQFIQSPLAFQHSFISYKIPGRIVSQDYKLGYRQSKHQLLSTLELENGTFTSPYVNDVGNDLTVREQVIYATARYQIKTKKIRSDIQLPISVQNISAFQPKYQKNEVRKGVLFLPEVNLTYNFTSERYLRATYQAQNTFTDITELYSGAVLQNFRSLQANEQGIQLKENYRLSLIYTHQNSIRLFFFNTGLTYRRTALPNIQSDSFSNNIRRAISLLFPNEQSALTLHGSLSQYIFPIKAKVGLKLQWQRGSSIQLLNKELFDLRSNGISLAASIDKRFAGWLDLSYQGRISWSQVQLSSKVKSDLPGSKIFSMNQQLRLNSIFAKKYQLGVTGTHRINRFSENQRNGFVFLDAVLKRTAILKGLDVELDCLNLFDVREYVIFLQQASQVSASSYQLRGRTFLVRLNYIF